MSGPGRPYFGRAACNDNLCRVLFVLLFIHLNRRSTISANPGTHTYSSISPTSFRRFRPAFGYTNPPHLMAKEVYVVVRIAPPVMASPTNYKPCLRFTARGESRPYLNIYPPKTRLNCLQMFQKRTPFCAGSFVKRRSEKYQGGTHLASSKERRLIFRLVLN